MKNIEDLFDGNHISLSKEILGALVDKKDFSLAERIISLYQYDVKKISFQNMLSSLTMSNPSDDQTSDDFYQSVCNIVFVFEHEFFRRHIEFVRSKLYEDEADTPKKFNTWFKNFSKEETKAVIDLYIKKNTTLKISPAIKLLIGHFGIFKTLSPQSNAPASIPVTEDMNTENNNTSIKMEMNQ